MTNDQIRVGINGFGRIGRMVARQIVANPQLKLVAVNDHAEDLGNLVYLYNYDSTYGRAPSQATVLNETSQSFMLDGHSVSCFSEFDVVNAPWESADVDVLVEATGVSSNVDGSHVLVGDERVRKVVVTHCPSVSVDLHLIVGVNEAEYDPLVHHVIASGICDANAIVHPIVHLDDRFGIEYGFVTTLHPWLSYQNLVDAPTVMQNSPGHYWTDYALGRSSVSTLIPKETTAVSALSAVVPDLASKFEALSFRVPTSVVSTADITIRLSAGPSIDSVRMALEDLCAASRVVEANYESLVGTDYRGSTASATIDMQWLKMSGDMLKLIVWYDNEWGYSARVVDLVQRVGLVQ